MTTEHKPHSMRRELDTIALAVQNTANDMNRLEGLESLSKLEFVITHLEEQLRAAETTLAHALDFIEHQDMSYRWAEWCDGRDPVGRSATSYDTNPATGSEAS